MRKLFLLVLIGGGVFLARRFAPRLEDIDWEKKFADMPEDFPPKWMFINISAIREQNERILELLAAERSTRLERRERTPTAA